MGQAEQRQQTSGTRKQRKATTQDDLIQNLTASVKLPGDLHEDDRDEDVPKWVFCLSAAQVKKILLPFLLKEVN